MTRIDETKRLKEDELEAVAGGVTATSMDPTIFHNDMQGYVAGHSTGVMPHASLPAAPTPLHTNLDSTPTTAAALTHAPTGGGGSHPTEPTLTGGGFAPIKR